MAVKDGEVVLCVVAILGIGVLLYCATQQTGDQPVPEHQSESQVMGLGVQAGMRVNAGTPLEMTGMEHIWHPGFDPDPHAQPTTEVKVRYPAVPGGNISTVMHNGWSQATQSAPAGYDWFLNPPEAAVI